MAVYFSNIGIRLATTICALTLLIANVGCAPKTEQSTKPSGTTKTTATFTDVQFEIFNKKCRECHNNALAFSGLDVTKYESILQFVVPGSPETSRMYLRQFSTTTFTLTLSEKQMLYSWILNGALKN